MIAEKRGGRSAPPKVPGQSAWGHIWKPFLGRERERESGNEATPGGPAMNTRRKALLKGGPQQTQLSGSRKILSIPTTSNKKPLKKWRNPRACGFNKRNNTTGGWLRAT